MRKHRIFGMKKDRESTLNTLMKGVTCSIRSSPCASEPMHKGSFSLINWLHIERRYGKEQHYVLELQLELLHAKGEMYHGM